MTKHIGIDINGNECRIPSKLSIWQDMEAVNVEMTRTDIKFIIMALEFKKKHIDREIEIMDKIGPDDKSELHLLLSTNLRNLSYEEIKEQRDSWNSWSRHFSWYIEKLEEYIGEEPEDGDSFPDEFDWTKMPVGINGICVHSPVPPRKT